MTQDNKPVYRSYRSLLRASAGFLTPGDTSLIRKALNLAIEACGNDRTPTGNTTLGHSVAVARILAAEMNLGTSSVIAALLHDTVKKPGVSDDMISDLFGSGIRDIIAGLRRVSTLNAKDPDGQAEYYRKLLLSLADDVRVIAIKLAERLDEMRNLDGSAEDVRLRLASEAYFLYAPLAYRLGFYSIKTEMEDLAMKYLEPDEYSFIEGRLKQTTSSRNKLVREMTLHLSEKLDRLKYEYQIKSRTKSIHSIWQKMKKQGVAFEEVYDIFALRIIADAPPQKEKEVCWQIYSLVTDIYQPNPSRLRDWISVPKSNGYESLHTTVIGPRGKWIEVQIRTRRMDEIAEKGLAAHYKYKGQKDAKGGLEVWLEKMRSLLESSVREEEQLIDQVKSGLYSDEVFVFTPDGELRRLRAGATVLDFAFDIHTELGVKCVGAKVNGKNTSIRYVLKNGDQVSILTSKLQKPKNDWLSFVVTGKARNRIKNALNEERVQAAADGKEILVRRLKNWKLVFSDVTINRILGKYNLKNARDLYVGISTGEIDLLGVKDFLMSDGEETPATPETAPLTARPGSEEKEEAIGDYLIIENKIEGIDYKLARCCNPVYGDKVFGFVTISEGVKIHRTGCPNAENMISRYPYRVVPAKWKTTGSIPAFLAGIKVTGVEDIGIVSRISEMLANYKVTIRNFTYNTNDNLFEGYIQLTVPNVNVLYGLIRNIQSIKGVLKAVRHDH